MSTALQTDIHQGMKRVASLDECPREKAIVEAIFMRADWVILPKAKLEVKSWVGGAVRAVEYRGLKYIEQNPNKPSASGQRARNGAKIVWVVNQQGEWIGKIEDGEVYHR